MLNKSIKKLILQILLLLKMPKMMMTKRILKK